jgi:hypothetical protein
MLGQLARELAELPGSESMKIRAMKREGTSWVLRGAVALGVIAAVITVIAATQDYGKPQQTLDIPADASLPAGILPVDARTMQKLDRWRVAQESDFTGAVLSWLRDNDERAEGRMAGDYTGLGGNLDAGYLLINQDSGKRRIVLVGHGVTFYDVGFDKLDGIGVLPHRFIERTEWAAPLPLQPDGDGLVLVLDGQDPNSAIVLFLKDKKLISAKPANYQRMRLE